jgi:thiosulfate dehydrogenase
MDLGDFLPVFWLVVFALAIGLFFVSKGLAAFRKLSASELPSEDFYKRRLLSLKIGQNLILGFLAILMAGSTMAIYSDFMTDEQRLAEKRNKLWPKFDKQQIWKAPEMFLAESDDKAELIVYGRDLITHTQDYFGESGLLHPGSINGLNCQSCHLESGTKPFGNNYSAVASTYPQMRARSGSLETIPKRINDCFQRSLNGEALDSTSREMRAIVAYMEWLGLGVPKGEKPKGAGLVEVPFLNRAADPVEGKVVYDQKCLSCHGADGNGLPMPDSPRNYPPLWGPNSYNEAAGLFRLSRFAGYVKANMPFGANFQNPQLTDEEAWDVAAFVNSQPRPKHPFLQTDWPKIEKKPFDHPFGPYADTFPELQHKFGPFGPIVAAGKK